LVIKSLTCNFLSLARNDGGRVEPPPTMACTL
jgi:hypothetical protein